MFIKRQIGIKMLCYICFNIYKIVIKFFINAVNFLVCINAVVIPAF